MADIFQPSKSSATRTTTPSAASQEMARFKAGILGQLLDAAARPRPSFADFASRGAALPANLPGGLSGGIQQLLIAMSQPGAFDTKVTETGRPSAPSLFSDLSQLGILGALLYQSGALGAGADKMGDLFSWLKARYPTGAAAGASASLDPSAQIGMTPDPSYYGDQIGMTPDPSYGSSSDQIGMTVDPALLDYYFS